MQGLRLGRLREKLTKEMTGVWVENVVKEKP
jgi:hypothetical protein